MDQQQLEEINAHSIKVKFTSEAATSSLWYVSDADLTKLIDNCNLLVAEVERLQALVAEKEAEIDNLECVVSEFEHEYERA
jgi:hypothetical protein